MGSKWLKRGLWLVGILWALFVFFAGNSPNDVGQRASGWLSLPVFREIPTTIVSFAARPWVIAVSFLMMGILIGWKLRAWSLRKSELPWWRVVANDLDYMAALIDAAGPYSDQAALNAELNVLRVKVVKHGLPFPAFEAGFKSFQSYMPYLRQVSAFLRAQEIEHAKHAARDLAERPPT
jgi:hypothetical protein